MPIPKPNMNIGSSTVLKSTVNIVSPIAIFGCPEALMTLFRPKYRWVTTLPSRIMNI